MGATGSHGSTGGRDGIQVEVAYGTPQHQSLLTVCVPAGATVAEAITASGILERHPELQPGGRNPVGVFGRQVPLETPLNEGGRVEIYRPLQVDPREIRRRRARNG